MITFLVGLGVGLVGGGAVVYVYYKQIVADLNSSVAAYLTAYTEAKSALATFKKIV